MRSRAAISAATVTGTILLAGAAGAPLLNSPVQFGNDLRVARVTP